MSYAAAPVTGVSVWTIGTDLDAAWLALWVDFVFFEFPRPGIFQSLGGVRVVDPYHPAAPDRLRWAPDRPAYDEGFYDPATRLIWVSAQADVWSVLVHEIGHHLQFQCGCLPDGSLAGRALLALYGALTARPDSEWVEHMATDFRRALFEPAPFPGAKQFYAAVAAAGGY